MNAAQCKAARQLLYATQADLAKWAKVGLSTLRDFESDRRATSTWTHRAIMNTLERMGVEFIGSTGVRMRGGVAVNPKKLKDVTAIEVDGVGKPVVKKRDVLVWQLIDENTPRDRRLLLCILFEEDDIPFERDEPMIVMGQWWEDKFSKRPKSYWTTDIDQTYGIAWIKEHQPTYWADPQPPKDA